jgi:hypothetical protein
MSPYKGKKKKAMQASTTRLPLGLARAVVEKPDKNEAAPISPVLKEMMGKSEEARRNRDECGVDYICECRDPNVDGNVAIPLAPGLEVNRMQFLKIWENEEDNTSENNRRWLEQEDGLLARLNLRGGQPYEVGGYRYPARFEYAGDITYDPMKPWDYYLMDEDVARLARATYSHLTLVEIAEDPDTLALMFRDVDRGARVFEQFDRTCESENDRL